MLLFLGPRFQGFLQEQCGGDEDDDETYDDVKYCIINAGYELRDVNTPRFVFFSAPSGDRDGAA